MESEGKKEINPKITGLSNWVEESLKTGVAGRLGGSVE